MAIFENKTEEKKAENVSTASAVKVTAGFRNILVQPRISEKAAKLQDSGKYVFKVAVTANKIEVKKAIENTYKVNVKQVNIIRVEGKDKNGRQKGSTSNFKKAIVTLKAGQRLEVGEAK